MKWADAVAAALADADHDQYAIDSLRRDVTMWRDAALRWIDIGLDYQIRLAASDRVLREQLDKLKESRKREARLQEQLDDERACWRRCAERLMKDDDA